MWHVRWKRHEQPRLRHHVFVSVWQKQPQDTAVEFAAASPIGRVQEDHDRDRATRGIRPLRVAAAIAVDFVIPAVGVTDKPRAFAPAKRELLFDLDTARRRMFSREGNSEDYDLIAKSLANLLRMWTED